MTDRVTRRVELDAGGALFAAGHDPDDPDDPDGRVLPLEATRMLVAVPPSAISLFTGRPAAGSARNTWSGRVSGLGLLTDRVRVAVDGRPDAIVDITASALPSSGCSPGNRCG